MRRASIQRPKSDVNASRQRILAAVDSIPRGCVATYGQVAREADLPGRARLVGHALRSLSPGSRIPWHRVINAAGRLSLQGASAAEQRRRLKQEGVSFLRSGRIPLEKFAWRSD